MKDWDAGFWGSYVAHAHLNGGEDAEVVLGEVAQGVHVKLHGVLPLLLKKLQGSGEAGDDGAAIFSFAGFSHIWADGLDVLLSGLCRGQPRLRARPHSACVAVGMVKDFNFLSR